MEDGKGDALRDFNFYTHFDGTTEHRIYIDMRVPICSRRSEEMFIGGQSTSKGQKIVVVVVVSPL